MKTTKQNWVLKVLVMGTCALTMMTGTAYADNVRGGVGELVINIDHDKMKNHPRTREIPRKSGNFVPYSSFVEHYFDQPTANMLKGYELIRGAQDGYLPVESTENLVFGMNGETVIHPLTTIDPVLFPDPTKFRDSFHHYLQSTSFYFDPNDVEGTVNGQIGFGGVLRIGYGDLTNESPDLGIGIQGIGDFALSYDREESEWVLKSNTGRGNPAGDRGRKPFSLEEVVVDTSVDGEFTISGILHSTSRSRRTGELRDGRFVPGEVLGSFSITAETTQTPIILDKIVDLKAESMMTVSDRPVRITANARLAQAKHYYNVAAANYRQNKPSIGSRFLKLSMQTIMKFKAVIETGISKNKFPEEEVLPLLEAVDSIHSDVHFVMKHPSAFRE